MTMPFFVEGFRSWILNSVIILSLTQKTVCLILNADKKYILSIK